MNYAKIEALKNQKGSIAWICRKKNVSLMFLIQQNKNE